MFILRELNLFSRIDRELVALDPEFTPRRVFSQLIYARSTIAKLDREITPFMVVLNLFPTRIGGSPSPIYFHRGQEELQTPTPIEYLIEEPHETPIRHDPAPLKKYIKEHLPLQGKLCQNRKGFIYVEIDDRYIQKLLPFIPDKKAKAAPYLESYSKPDGAHIPAILANERTYIETIEELGEVIPFTIHGFYSTVPHWNGVDKVWYLTVKAPRLLEIRERYRLSPRIGGHDFHIAIAILPAEKKKKFPSMRINQAFLSA